MQNIFSQYARDGFLAANRAKAGETIPVPYPEDCFEHREFQRGVEEHAYLRQRKAESAKFDAMSPEEKHHAGIEPLVVPTEEGFVIEALLFAGCRGRKTKAADTEGRKIQAKLTKHWPELSVWLFQHVACYQENKDDDKQS